MERNHDDNDLHVVMFPFFAFGHISPFLQLSSKLSSRGVKISFFSASGNVDRIKSMLKNSPTTEIISLTLPYIEGLPPGIESTSEMSPESSELLKVALDRMQPQVKTLFLELKPHFAFFDFAQEWLPLLAAELGIKTIFYSVFTAIATAFLSVPSRVLDSKRVPTVDEMKLPPLGFPRTSVTSLKTFEARDFLYIFKSFHGGASVFDRVLTGLKGCSAILIKTCNEMEADYINYVKNQFKKPIFLIGPVVPQPPKDELEQKWCKWLNLFAEKSVIYCSFGSETFLTQDQIQELVLGLDLTGLPFFLVLNFPSNLDPFDELNRSLPQNFANRVKNKAIIHTGWVQQQQILAHKSVGCYVCHAGFSSVIEALVNDCQLVMLPQKGDQFLNAKLVSEDLKCGVEVNRRDEDGYFSKDDVKEAVESVMMMVEEVGEEREKIVRENQKKWRDFLVDDDVQEKFVYDLVKDMKEMVGTSSI